jgi:hypothetical protein
MALGPVKRAFSLRTNCVPVPLAMLVSIRPADGSALDSAVRAGTVYSASKRQHRAGLCPEQDTLLIDRSFQFSLLSRTLMMTGDDAALLCNLNSLRSVPAIRALGVNCPIASDVGWRFLRDGVIAARDQKKQQAEHQQRRAVALHSSPTNAVCKSGCEHRQTFILRSGG